ncbi:MAG: Mov34/MPN/PAD-1 family protein [Planctomycetota bacterium]
MDKFWIEKAHKYIGEHASFSNVSSIFYSKNSTCVMVTADVSVGLPASFIEQGVTPLGMKPLEPVTFVFPQEFPLQAPIITLRDDFPRCFPHINPTLKSVSPCIFDGSLTELLQQSEWMNGILNQLVDWLEKAASDSLLDYSQGWEPMRNDDPKGFILYDTDEAIVCLKKNNYLSVEMRYEERNGRIVIGDLCDKNKQKECTALFCVSPNHRVVDQYIPNPVIQLSELYVYAAHVGIPGVKDYVERIDKDKRNEDKMIVVLAVLRPCKIIGFSTNYEFLHFVIHKPKRKKNKKRVVSNAPVGMLSHIARNTPSLLKRMSGSKHNLDEKKSIALVGCGSLGSKIGMHLVRNGSGPFLCVDNDVFLPHNNARHALTFTSVQNKACLLSLAMYSVAKSIAQVVETSVLSADFSQSRLIIDSSASFEVRSFLMSAHDIPPVISAAIYTGGAHGILLLESVQRETQLTDLWAHLYRLVMDNPSVRKILFDQQRNRVSIGQSCSSYTLVVSDAQISLYAASFSLRIQTVLEDGLSRNGQIVLASCDEVGNLSSEVLNIPQSIEIQSIIEKNWEVRLSSVVADRMREAAQKGQPNETGGVLLGSVFMNAKVIVVVDILPPPSDSVQTPALFVLGIEGLEKEIKRIEQQTCGKVTYLGTWHSHPGGGAASDTDKRTSERLLFLRNYEPTVCLIWTPDEIFEV